MTTYYVKDELGRVVIVGTIEEINICKKHLPQYADLKIQSSEEPVELWQPPQPDNEVISPRQMRLYLLQKFGISSEQLDALVAGNETAKIELEYAIEINKQNPLIIEFAKQLGLDAPAITTMFNEAQTL